MVHWDVPRTPASIRLLVELGEEHGVPAATSLAGTGLEAAGLHDPRLEVSAVQELAVIGNLVAVLGEDRGLGLEAGVRYHLTTYGIWGFALLSSPTMRSAIEVGLRYLDLTFVFCRVGARERDDRVELVLDAPDVPARLRRFVIERDAAAIEIIQRELFGGALPVAGIRFALEPPRDTARYREIFGVEPVFGAAETVAVVDPALLDQPLPQADEHATALAQEQCRELLALRRARGGVAGRVRDRILAEPASPPSAAAVAAELHLSARTLRHHLAGEGTSYRALLEEIREQIAEELLLTGRLPVAEVARRLGYAEVSGFSQAFRRWKGVGPRAYRASRTPVRIGAGAATAV